MAGQLDEERQIQVRFVTKLPAELRVASTPFSLPTHLSRYGLSEVINALLGLEKQQPFDFLVDGELLRTSLEQILLDKKLSAETTLVIEYAYAVGPPKREKSHEHNDWVSAVEGSHPRFIVTGSYDNSIRIWGASGSIIQSLEGHKDPVTSLKISMPTVDGEKWNLISGSKDHTVRVWQLSQTSSKDAANSELSLSQPVKVLKGHTSSVQCVTSDRSGTAVCSGSWDCSIKLWNVSERENEEGPAIQTKRRKLNASTEVQELEVCATITLEGHKQCVSAVSWGERGSVVSASWDHSIRSWDVETSINTETLVGAKALHCLSVGGENMSLFAAGGADPVLRIWDPRMPGTNTPIFQLSSHNAWISACKWHSSSSHHIFSASYDGSIKLWDLRSKIPLLTIDAHKGKVLSADWWNKDSIVSGGTDSLLQIFSGFHRS